MFVHPSVCLSILYTGRMNTHLCVFIGTRLDSHAGKLRLNQWTQQWQCGSDSALIGAPKKGHPSSVLLGSSSQGHEYSEMLSTHYVYIYILYIYVYSNIYTVIYIYMRMYVNVCISIPESCPCHSSSVKPSHQVPQGRRRCERWAKRSDKLQHLQGSSLKVNLYSS